MGGKGQGSSLQEGVSHTYTLRLSQSIDSILYKKKKISNMLSYYNFIIPCKKNLIMRIFTILKKYIYNF